jgi:hypothetical protein
MKFKVLHTLSSRLLLIALATAMVVAVSTDRGLSYQLTANPASLNLTARMGDTATGYIKITDGHNPSATPMKASMHVYGDDACQIACPSIIFFAGSTYIPIIYIPRGSQSSGNLVIITDSGSVSVLLNGICSDTGRLDLYPAIKSKDLPIIDSFMLHGNACEKFEISNHMTTGVNDSVIITAMRVEPWKSNVQFSFSGVKLPQQVGWGKIFNFQICALKLDAKDSNLLIGFLHTTFSSPGSVDSCVWPLFARIIPLDTSCLSVNGGRTDMGSIFEGDTVIESFQLHNLTSTLVTIDSAKFINGDIERFEYISPSFPFTIAPNGNDSISIKFRVPPQALTDKYTSNLEFWPLGLSRHSLPCGTYTIPISGHPAVHQCLSYSSSKLAPVPEGFTEQGYDTIFNNTDQMVAIDSVKITGGDLLDFKYQYPAFPAQIAAHSNLVLGYWFTAPVPSLRSYLSTQITLWASGTRPDGLPCNTLSLGNTGQLLIPWDTILVQLPPSSSDTIRVEVHAALTYHLLTIQNSTTNKIFLASAKLIDTGRIVSLLNYSGPHCVNGAFGANTFCFDDSLTPGAWSDSMSFMMQVSDSGVYPITLSVNFTNALQAQNYVLLLHYSWPQNASVRTPRTSSIANFTLNPNPASGQVTISLPSDYASTIEIYDILGKLLFQKVAAGAYVWNGESSSGILPAGSYIVRVSQADPSNGFITASKRLIYKP